jgi:hypothetical protein
MRGSVSAEKLVVVAQRDGDRGPVFVECPECDERVHGDGSRRGRQLVSALAAHLYERHDWTAERCAFGVQVRAVDGLLR